MSDHSLLSLFSLPSVNVICSKWAVCVLLRQRLENLCMLIWHQTFQWQVGSDKGSCNKKKKNSYLTLEKVKSPGGDTDVFIFCKTHVCFVFRAHILLIKRAFYKLHMHFAKMGTQKRDKHMWFIKQVHEIEIKRKQTIYKTHKQFIKRACKIKNAWTF